MSGGSRDGERQARDRWDRVQRLFHRASELPEEERRSFLEGECGDDPSLADEVLTLLSEDAREVPLLDGGVASLAGEVLSAPQAWEGRPRAFGPYRILKLLGEGGMGVVYLAEREDLGNRVALKILRDATLSPSRRERFLNEQRTLAHLRHPAIARLMDAGTLADGTPWFVMEYVDGMPLTAFCRAGGLEVRERLELFLEVCRAVQHAHRHAVIHRDLKPSNLLVTDQGEVKVIDFGIAKHLEDTVDEAARTRTGLRLMTPAYAAPEQVEGKGVGTHTDVYALGVVLFRILTGRLPFDLSERTPLEAARVIVESEPARPSALVREDSRPPGEGVGWDELGRAAWTDLDVLCFTAMEKEPGRRYPTVEALIRDVEAFLEGRPLAARPATLGYRASRFVGRNRAAVLVASLVLTLGVALTGFYTSRLAAARDAALAEAARTERIQRFTLNLFQGDDPAVAPADSLRVVTLLERGVQEARALGGEPALQAELYLTLGEIYRQLGRLDRADTLIVAALEGRRELHGSEHPDVAEALVALGLLRDAQAEFDQAERLIREGLGISRRTLPPGHPSLARATAALGHVLETRGSYAEALPVVEEAVRLLTAGGDRTPELAAAASQLVNVHFYLGDYAAADSLGLWALELSREVHGEGHPTVASDLINLGAVRFERGRADEAERLYREALEIQEAWYGRAHPAVAANLTMLGRALVRQERLGEGAEVLEEALEVNEDVYGPVHPRVASALNELGLVAQHRGELARAEAVFRRVWEIYREVYEDSHYYIGVAQSNLAGIVQAQGDPAGAALLFRDVLRLYAEVLPPEHQLEAIARIRLGRALLLQGFHQEAADELLLGHGILERDGTSPAWLDRAREDLVQAYQGLGRLDLAAPFRGEDPTAAPGEA